MGTIHNLFVTFIGFRVSNFCLHPYRTVAGPPVCSTDFPWAFLHSIFPPSKSFIMDKRIRQVCPPPFCRRIFYIDLSNLEEEFHKNQMEGVLGEKKICLLTCIQGSHSGPCKDMKRNWQNITTKHAELLKGAVIRASVSRKRDPSDVGEIFRIKFVRFIVRFGIGTCPSEATSCQIRIEDSIGRVVDCGQ